MINETDAIKLLTYRFVKRVYVCTRLRETAAGVIHTTAKGLLRVVKDYFKFENHDKSFRLSYCAGTRLAIYPHDSRPTFYKQTNESKIKTTKQFPIRLTYVVSEYYRLENKRVLKQIRDFLWSVYTTKHRRL